MATNLTPLVELVRVECVPRFPLAHRNYVSLSETRVISRLWISRLSCFTPLWFVDAVYFMLCRVGLKGPPRQVVRPCTPVLSVFLQITFIHYINCSQSFDQLCKEHYVYIYILHINVADWTVIAKFLMGKFVSLATHLHFKRLIYCCNV